MLSRSRHCSTTSPITLRMDVLAHLLHTPAHTFWSGELVHGGVSLECGGFAASDGEVPVIPQLLTPTPTDTHTCVDVYIMQGHL